MRTRFLRHALLSSLILSGLAGCADRPASGDAAAPKSRAKTLAVTAPAIPVSESIDPSISNCNVTPPNTPVTTALLTSGTPCQPTLVAPFDLDNLQHGFDYYSWLTFIALNAPSEGVAPAPGPDADTQWQQWREVSDLMLPGGAQPGPWDAPRVVPDACKGIPLVVTETPAGRNSQPYQNRRVCAGNTNCIPICPIQAKYDPSVTLNMALDTGNVTLMTQTVASEIIVDANNQVSQINYIQYADNLGPATAKGAVSAKRYVLAAHAVETPKLCLMSKNNGLTEKGVANSSGLMGQNLMDHPLYLAWAQAAEPVFGFRGPLATSGIESMRDGDFRKDRAAFRIEIGNEGWNFAIGDPWTTTLDFINGWNNSQLNPKPPASTAPQALWGTDLVAALNDGFSRQFRLGFLVEQSPETSNYVTVSTTEFDHLGLPRPEIVYDLSDYTKAGFVAAKKTADAIFEMMGATQFTTEPDASDPAAFEVEIDGKTQRLKFFGAGHIVGTYRMGTTSTNSVVDADQRSWDHKNLFLVGSGNFPTVATANPTLTIAALALKAAQTLLDDLG